MKSFCRMITFHKDLGGNNLGWVDNSGYPPPNKAVSV